MQWIDLLPHRPPMRLLDEVTAVQPGAGAVGRRVTHPSDFYFQGHFPGQPIVPAIILIEMLAQAGGIAAASDARRDAPSPGRHLRVAAVGPFKFPAGARPGETLEARARVAARVGALVKIEGDVLADGRLVARGTITLAGAPDA